MTPINAPGAPAAIGPYCHAVKVGNLLFTSGQIPLTLEGTMPEGIEAQTGQVFDNLTLTGKAPALLMLVPTQCLGLEIGGLTTHAAHQAGMATARPATVGHRHANLIQGIEQVGVRGN